VHAIARDEGEALVIEVVTVGDAEVCRDAPAVLGDRSGKSERIFRIEKIGRLHG